MLLLSSEYSPPPGALYGLLGAWGIGVGLTPSLLLVGHLGGFWGLSRGEQFLAELVALPFGLFAATLLFCHPLAQRTLRRFASGAFGVELFAELSRLAGRAGALRGLSRL